jgi:hypothetical protein
MTGGNVMRLAVLCTVVLAAVSAPPARSATGDPTHVPPSSLAPHAPHASRVYGVPIQSQILHHVKPKPKAKTTPATAPQLR